MLDVLLMKPQHFLKWFSKCFPNVFQMLSKYLCSMWWAFSLIIDRWQLFLVLFSYLWLIYVCCSCINYQLIIDKLLMLLCDHL